MQIQFFLYKVYLLNDINTKKWRVIDAFVRITFNQTTRKIHTVIITRACEFDSEFFKLQLPK